MLNLFFDVIVDITQINVHDKLSTQHCIEMSDKKSEIHRSVNKFSEFQIFIHRQNILLIFLHQMFEVVPLIFNAESHPFNPLVECLLIFLNRNRIEFIGDCFG